MDQPWRRINEILNASAHPTRTTEHIVYVRMLQRSKNQHRHGFYYRRLQHVQRLLRNINAHPAWDLLETSDFVNRGNTGRGYADKTSSSRSKQQRKGHAKTSKENEILSTPAKDKIETLVNLMEALVEQVIPRAARSIAIHLIALGQFLPYAITMCACLARIFVTERALRNELRMILRDINVLLAGKTLGCTSMNAEDIGIAVSDEDVVNKQKSVKTDPNYDCVKDQSQVISSHESDEACDKHHDKAESSLRKASRPGKTRQPKNLRQENDAGTPSLYDVIAETGVPQNMLDEIAANADALHMNTVQHVSGPDDNSNSAKVKKNRKRKRKKSTLTIAPEEKHQKLDGEKAGVEEMASLGNTMATMSHPMNRNQVTQSGKELMKSTKDKNFKGSDESIKISNSKPIKNERSASDSEDIDDIFGDLT